MKTIYIAVAILLLFCGYIIDKQSKAMTEMIIARQENLVIMSRLLGQLEAYDFVARCNAREVRLQMLEQQLGLIEEDRSAETDIP